MAKFCQVCKIKIKEGGLNKLMGQIEYVEFEDGFLCKDCADSRKRKQRDKDLR